MTGGGLRWEDMLEGVWLRIAALSVTFIGWIVGRVDWMIG
jgi:hypothetical protein